MLLETKVLIRQAQMRWQKMKDEEEVDGNVLILLFLMDSRRASPEMGKRSRAVKIKCKKMCLCKMSLRANVNNGLGENFDTRQTFSSKLTFLSRWRCVYLCGCLTLSLCESKELEKGSVRAYQVVPRPPINELRALPTPENFPQLVDFLLKRAE